MRLMILIAIAITAFATHQATAAPQIQLRDWLVTCDDYQNCAASTQVDKDPSNTIVPDYQLTISRGAYETFWKVSLTTFVAQPNTAKPVLVDIDGAQTTLSGSGHIAAFDALNEYFLLGKTVQKIMDQLVLGTKVAITFEDQAGTAQSAELSLSGLAASLLWIDEHQQRLGSERVAGPPPEDKIEVTDRTPTPIPQSVLARRNTDPSCYAVEELPNLDDKMSYRLSATQTLHLLPCWAGAYNYGYLAFIDDGERIEQQYFASFSETLGWSGTNVLVNPYFDEVTGLLSDFYKGRGLGDCGTSGTWRWARWGFKLLEYSAREKCDTPEAPYEFPIIYRAADFVFPDEAATR